MEYRLKDILQDKGYIRGPFGSSLKRNELKNVGIPVYEQQHAIYATREFRYYIDEEKYSKMKRFTVKPNDLIISCSGTIGKVDLISEKDKIGIISQALLILRVNTDIAIPEYLFYFFKSNYGYNSIVSRSMGSVQVNIAKREVIENIKINIPSKKEQEKIVNILSIVDKKIELNNQINNNLYKLSQELFKRWFIDFEFPNSDGLEYKSANGTFKEVNGEQIPVDWQIMRLDEVAECQNGNAFYKDGYDESGIMVVDLGNVNINGSFIYTNADKYISQERIQSNPKYSKYGLYKNDLVMVMTDRKATMDLLGKTGKIYENKQYLLNQRMYRIRSKINVNYLYTVLNSSKILDKLKSKALGSVQKYVNTGHINELKILVGTDEIMEKFSQIVNPIFERIENNILENDSLQKMRDTLLPKLMNGEVDMENVEI